MMAKVGIAVAIVVVLLLLFVLASLLAIGLAPGSGGSDSSGPTPVTRRAVTLAEAESLLPFDVKLPVFLPEATAPTPTFYVEFDDQGRPDWLEANFRELDGAEGRGLRIRITQSLGDSFFSGSEQVKIADVAVQLEASRTAAELFAEWSQAGMLYDAEFAWLRDGQPEGGVTAEMRGEALRVVRSMIEGDP